MLWHGKNFRGILTKAKEMIFDNTGTNLVSTNAEDAIKEVNTNLSSINKVLWTNPSRRTAITASTTVQLSEAIDDYDEIKVLADNYISGTVVLSTSGAPTNGSVTLYLRMMAQNSSTRNLSFTNRSVTITGANATISTGELIQQGQAPVQTNNDLIPYQIIGIKYV